MTPRFVEALTRAATWHADQRRKNTRNVPYVSHLMATAALVLEDGGDEDQAIAGLLHDSIEDQGISPELLTDLFGPEVSRIVVACSDATGPDKPPWLDRKRDHLAHLRDADVAVLRVTAADKLHNCRDVVADVIDEGPARLDRFRGGRQGTCWYYGQMTLLLERALPASRLTRQLGEQARELHRLAGYDFPAPQPSPTTTSPAPQPSPTTTTAARPRS